MPAIPLQRLLHAVVYGHGDGFSVQDVAGDGNIDPAGGLGQGMPVGQARNSVDLLHGSGRSGNIFSILSVQDKGNGQNTHQGAIPVFFHFIAAAQGGGHTTLIAVDRLGTGVSEIKAGPTGRIGALFKPLPKPFHNIMGVKVAHLGNTLCKTKSHAAVVGPEAHVLSPDAPIRHPGDGVLPQIFPGTAFRRHTQCVCNAQSIDPIPNLRHSNYLPVGVFLCLRSRTALAAAACCAANRSNRVRVSL